MIAQVRKVKKALVTVRNDVNNYHHKWFTTAATMGDQLDIWMNIPRLCGRQKRRENVEAETAEIYYCRMCSIPFSDFIIEELSSRFQQGREILPNANAIVPSQLIQDNDWREKFMQFANQYSSDLPNEQSLIAELNLWNNLWNGKINVPDTAQSTFQETDAILFPNIHETLKIVCTIPVTTCECERSVSGL